MAKDEQFIDEDSGYSNQKNTYEEIVLRQIRETSILLSKELTGSAIRQENKVFVRSDDLRIKAYNAIDTLRMLLLPFLKDEDTLKKISDIKDEIKNYIEEQGEKTKEIKGVKYKIKNLVQDSNSVEFNLLWEFKLEKARELFEVLIVGYQKNKSYLASFEKE